MLHWFVTSCLFSLFFSPVKVKKFLIQMNAVYDLVDILEHFVTAPHVAAEALGVIACLSDIGKLSYLTQ